jgi:hypothetical protein
VAANCDAEAGGSHLALRNLSAKCQQSFIGQDLGQDTRKRSRQLKVLLFSAPHRSPRERRICLPGDQHIYDGCLARAGSQFWSEAEEFRIGFVVRVLEVFEQTVAGFADFGRDPGQPGGNFNGFNLAEEGADAVK